ncbi:MAG TPA: hypothetical protein VFV87_05135, partial [Pirellulaceae bacterium]|nr:hypothetical protein [Pirellulaceae bacterium]
TEIKMEWNAKKGVDPFEQYAAFRTNDPRRPEFKLIVFGQILETLRSEPPEAIFNRVSSQESARATLKVFGLRGDKLEIIRHQFEDEPSAKFFEVSFQPLPQEEVSKRKGFKCGIEIIVELKPGMPLGQMKQTIQITTNLNPDATFDIPVYGSVVSDISLVGQHTSAESMTVSMGTIASAKGAKATVYFVVKGEHRDQTTLQITKVSPSAELEVKLGEPIRDNPQIVSFPVTLEVPPGTAPVSRASAGGEVTVRVETTHPSVKELTFRVRYAVVE